MQQESQVSLKINQISSAEGSGRVTSWGFPRGITQNELTCDQWWSYKNRVIWWMEPTVPGIVAPHVAIHPEWRHKFLPLIRCWEEVQGQVAQKFGQTILVVVPPFGAIGPYLERLGFTLNPERGWFIREIGDDNG